jgi:hypothetical protein
MILAEQTQYMLPSRLRKNLGFVQCPVAILRMDVVPE